LFVFRLYSWLTQLIGKILPEWLLPLFARIIFLGVLFVPYWRSAITKFGEGLTGLFVMSPGAYVQIFPKAMESVGYDKSQLSAFHHLIVFFGTYSEIILPVLIVVGLATQLAALGMIGFLIVQSWVDVFGHGLSGGDIGSWFDNVPYSILFDQRAFWIFLLLYLVIKGAGKFSLDTLVCRMISNSQKS